MTQRIKIFYCNNMEKPIEKLSQQDKLSKFCMDAGFLRVVENAQYFMTKDTGDLTQFHAVACREYTLPREDEASQPKGWIQGNTKIGPVLEVATSYLQHPRRDTINPREHGKPTMPKKTLRPMSLVLSHEIVKLRIFTNFNKRRKGTFPKQVTIIIRRTTKPTWNRLPPDLAKQNTYTPPTTTLRSRASSLSRTREELGAAKSHGHLAKDHHENLLDHKNQLQPCSAQASRTAALKC